MRVRPLAFDTNSPYLNDRAPLVACQPEQRRYRVRLVDNDIPSTDTCSMRVLPYRSIALLWVSGVGLLAGCGSALDPGVWHMKQAAPYKVASMWKPTTSRPSREAIENAQSYDHERFVRQMRTLLPYPMAIHAIGWFGDVWDLHLIAPHLSSPDRDTRMVALAAFSRLSGEQFTDTSAAINWWGQNRETIPQPRDAAKKE